MHTYEQINFNQIELIMKKSLLFSFVALLISATFFVTSCTEDFEAPTVALSEEAIDAKAGEEISVTVTVTAPAGLDKVVATMLHDGVAVGTPMEYMETSFTYTYTVTEDDVDPILSINFTATDLEGQEGEKELVVDVELTMTQLLLKYDWLLSEEIRETTNTNDISDVYTDDLYRFYEDGTYDKSIGAKVDAFSDLWFNYCYWKLDEATSTLIMSRTGAYLEDVRDTINITLLDATELRGNVVYYGLDVFDPSYAAVENYEKVFAAMAKGENFDPYQIGSDDDAGPAGVCNDVTLK